MANQMRTGVFSCLACGLLLLSSCAIPPPAPREPSAGHISTATPPAPVDIPAPVVQAPILPAPVPVPAQETYTVVVNDVPVRELLFALSRDAAINVDIHPSIEGTVTLNAIDQTLDQILARISRQMDLRYEMRDGVLVVGPDLPYLKSYRVDYVNMSRDASGDISTSTEVATTGGTGGGSSGGGGNASSTTVSNVSNHRFWETLARNIIAILGDDPSAGEGEMPQTASVIVSPESSLISVRATHRQHAEVQKYLDLVMTNVRRQVLIEATIVEVLLDDRYQAGVDFSRLARGAGFSVTQTLLGGFTAAAGGATTGLLLRYVDQGAGSPIDTSISLLQEFGETHVLSTPKLMTLNNQTAVLKVVDNEVFFTVSLEEDQQDNGNQQTTVTSEVNTVAVGLIMSVTPQIDATDTITLNIRPTITRIREFRSDPGAAIIAARLGAGALPVANLVPVVQVREAETMLKVGSGQIAVLGGLMQDRTQRDTDSIPVISDIDVIGDAFKAHDRQYTKSELVVFLRPWVVSNPDVVRGDVRSMKPFLPENVPQLEPIRTSPAY